MAAKIEQRRLEASYGGDEAVAARGDQDRARERERGRKGVWRANFNANLGNKLTVTEECLIGSESSALLGGFGWAALGHRRRCGVALGHSGERHGHRARYL